MKIFMKIVCWTLVVVSIAAILTGCFGVGIGLAESPKWVLDILQGVCIGSAGVLCLKLGLFIINDEKENK